MATAAPMQYPPPPALGSNPFPHSSMPIAGVTSGLLSSGLNYPVLKQLPPSLEGQPPLSPLQQWVTTPEGLMDKMKRKGAAGAIAGAAGAAGGSGIGDAAVEAAQESLGVGNPVRICNFFTKGSDVYNGLVGDIIAVTTERAGHGEEEFLFDVRCPCGSNRRRTGAGSNVPVSPLAQAAVVDNRRQIAPQYGVSAEEASLPRDDMRLPPLVLLYRIPSEKLEALL